jgi:hypothetical protein
MDRDGRLRALVAERDRAWARIKEIEEEGGNTSGLRRRHTRLLESIAGIVRRPLPEERLGVVWGPK